MPEIDPLRLPSDAAFMAEYHKSQTREVMNYYLQKMADTFETICLSYRPSQNMNDLIYHQGVLAGLKMAMDVPENVLLWAKNQAGEHSKPKKLGELTLA